MATVDIPFPSSSNPGGAPGEGSGRVLNCYAYKDGDAVRWKPLPGLTPFAILPYGPVRGFLFLGGLLLVVIGSKVVQVDGAGNVTVLEGTVAGIGPVTIVRNNALIPDVTIASNNSDYVLSGIVVQSYPDANLPQSNSVTFLDGYFLWTTSNGNIWASGLNVTSVDALSSARAEARPDGLLRGIVYGQQFFAFGQSTIEVWQDAGTSPFPLSRSAVIPIGLAGQWAVAGQEDGWGGPLIFVAADGSVRSLDGYTPTRISGEDLERLIESTVDKSTLRAVVYTFGGNAIWSLSSNYWTWEYNVTTGSWHERQSLATSRWKGSATVQAFGSWLVADVEGGTLYYLDDEDRSEGLLPIVWGLDSGPVKQFPERIQCPGAAFDFVLGQASLIDSTPFVMVSWSHDGGAVWSNPVVRTVGTQGRFKGRVTINRIGLSTPAGVRWRFRVSDPAYTSFAGGRMDAEGR